MTDLTTSIKHFTSLSRSPGSVWTEATKRKAQHKPLLLLAVLDLVHRGVITTPFIDVTTDLVVGRNRDDSETGTRLRNRDVVNLSTCDDYLMDLR